MSIGFDRPRSESGPCHIELLPPSYVDERARLMCWSCDYPLLLGAWSLREFLHRDGTGLVQDALRAHHQKLNNTTLAEMTDWGWFSEETT